jgi:hypothetical protein
MRDWRSGSLRERRPGVWEIRIAAATDPVTGRSNQRSFSVHGDRLAAEARCDELAADYAASRIVLEAAPFITVGGVLESLVPPGVVGFEGGGRALRCRSDALRSSPAI